MLTPKTSHPLSLILPLLLLYLLAWQIQTQLFLNYDVSWLIHAARRLLAGGTYSRDFFETNPPLILYLYCPPVLLSKWLGAPLILVFRVYIFLLASLSLGICALLVRKIFKSEDSLLTTVFMLTVTAIFLLLPVSSFGQREHLLLIFALPYLLLIAARLGGNELNPYAAFAIGLFASLGFAIKPHFLMTPFLLELYYAFKRKSWMAWLRPEIFALLSAVGLYGISIFIFQPEYIYIILPYTLRLYYSAMGKPWLSFGLHAVTLYSAFVFLFYWLFYKDNPYPILSTVLLLGMISCFFAYLAQKMQVYYHLLPVLSLGTLLLVTLFATWLSRYCKTRLEVIFAALLAVIIFSAPLKLSYNVYCTALVYKEHVLNKLVAFMNQYARHQSVYLLSAAGYYIYPVVDYTSTTSTPRFYFLWMAAGLKNQELASVSSEINKDKNYLINMVADDLYSYKPTYIIVDQRTPLFALKDHHSTPNFFSTHPKFHQEWKNYSYFTTLEQPTHFKLAIYKRTPNP